LADYPLKTVFTARKVLHFNSMNHENARDAAKATVNLIAEKRRQRKKQGKKKGKASWISSLISLLKSA